MLGSRQAGDGTKGYRDRRSRAARKVHGMAGRSLASDDAVTVPRSPFLSSFLASTSTPFFQAEPDMAKAYKYTRQKRYGRYHMFQRPSALLFPRSTYVRRYGTIELKIKILL